MHHNMPPEADTEARGNLTAAETARVDVILDWLKAEGMTEAAFCKASNMKQAMWSALKQGKYTQARMNDQHIARLEQSMKTLRAAKMPEDVGPVKGDFKAGENLLLTPALEMLFSSVKMSLRMAAQGSENKLTMYVQKAGAGKTTASNALVQEFTGLACNAKIDWRLSRKCMMEDIARGLGLPLDVAVRSPGVPLDPAARGTGQPLKKRPMKTYELSRSIMEYFSTPKLLVLNELGPHTVSGSMVAWLRELLNDTRAVIVLCAVPELLDTLAATMRDELDQVEQRGRLIRGGDITAEQVQWFMVRTRGAEIAAEAAEVIAAEASGYGCFRAVKTIAALKTPLETIEQARAAYSAYRSNRHIELPPRRSLRRQRAA